MAKLRPTEERLPLLLYFVENDQELSGDNKRLFSDKSRFQRINDGVIGVLSEWPSYFGSCWVATVLIGLLFFMLMLILVGSSTNSRVPRCVPQNELDSKSIHLVHKCREWSTDELNYLQNIIDTFSTYKIHIISINCEFKIENTSTTTLTPIARKKRSVIGERKKRNVKNRPEAFQFNLKMGAKKLFEMIIKQRFNENTTTTTTTTEKPIIFQDILDKYPLIVLENRTLEEIFNNTLLGANFKLFQNDVQIFATRILQLWQFGGLSFDLHTNQLQQYKKNAKKIVINPLELKNTTEKLTKASGDTIREYLEHEKFVYESLPESVVVSDEYGFHMESKTPCHAFFGEILMQLRRIRKPIPIKDILRRSLKTFCRHSGTDRRFCDRL